MLVLSRKSRESVVVGDTIGSDRKLVVTVLEIRGGQVQLGFDAPADVAVHRMEIWERIRLNAAPAVVRSPSREIAEGPESGRI